MIATESGADQIHGRLTLVADTIESALVAQVLAVLVAQRAPFLARLDLAAAVGVPLALAGQPHGDVDAAHDREAVHAEQRRVLVGVRGARFTS